MVGRPPSFGEDLRDPEAELIERQKPWRSVEHIELATAEWVAWCNSERLHGACGDIPPTEFETAYRQRLQATTKAA
jgi:putative transposase